VSPSGAFGEYPQFEAYSAVPCSETDNPSAFSAWSPVQPGLGCRQLLRRRHPYEGALTASRLLKNARLLSHAGWGHKAYLTVGNACVDDTVTQYQVTRRAAGPRHGLQAGALTLRCHDPTFHHQHSSRSSIAASATPRAVASQCAVSAHMVCQPDDGVGDLGAEHDGVVVVGISDDDSLGQGGG
jgi:TAP-like protein